MSYWELRQAIESATPWWGPFAFAGACMVVVIVVDEFRKRRKQKRKSGAAS